MPPNKFTSEETLDAWFAHQPPTSQEIADAHATIRRVCRELAQLFSDLLPECPDKTVALRAVRDAMMQANACLAVEQRLYDAPDDLAR